MTDIQRTTDSEDDITEEEIMEIVDSDEVIYTNG